MTELSKVANAFNGKTPSKAEKRQEGLPILKVRDIDENSQFVGQFGSFVDKEFYRKYAKKKLHKGDTVILNAAHSAEYVGSKQAFIPAQLDGVIATGEWLIVRPKAIIPEFINYYLKSPVGKRGTKKLVKGIHLYPRDVERIKVPNPPKDDQIRIATLLRRIETLIATRKEDLRLLDEFLKSTFLDMFGDIRAKSSRYKWEKPRPYLKASSGKSSKDVKTETETEYPIYGGNGINGWAIEPLYHENVVIAGRVGQQCGIIHVSNGPCWVTDNAIVIKITDPKKLNATYLATAYQHAPIREKVKQLDLPFINQSMLLDYPLPMPPIEEQNTFTTIVSKVEFIKTQYQLNLAELENLYGALSQKAFKGELDLSRIPLEMSDDQDEDESSSVLVDDEDVDAHISTSFAQEDILSAIKGLSEQEVTFESLMEQLQRQARVELLGYEQIKEELFSLIEQGKVEQCVTKSSNGLAFVLKG